MILQAATWKPASLKATPSRLDKYSSWLKRQPLSEQTRRAYRSRIQRFLEFLDASGEVLEQLTENERELLHVLRNYKRHLKQIDKNSPATVNAHLTAIDHYLQFLGAKAPEVPRKDLPEEVPRALEKDEQQHCCAPLLAAKGA